MDEATKHHFNVCMYQIIFVFYRVNIDNFMLQLSKQLPVSVTRLVLIMNTDIAFVDIAFITEVAFIDIRLTNPAELSFQLGKLYCTSIATY